MCSPECMTSLARGHPAVPDVWRRPKPMGLAASNAATAGTARPQVERPLGIDVTLEAAVTVVRVVGEVDALGAPQLAEALRAELEPSPSDVTVVVDLQAVELFSGAGVTV